MNENSQTQNPQSNESVSAITSCIERASLHFEHELGEEQIDVYIDELKKYSAYQIREGFGKCLIECQFFPRLVEVVKRMPERRDAPKPYVLRDTPGQTMTTINDLAEQMAQDVIGCSYASLGYSREDDQKRYKLFFEAARERYRRMGIDPDRWGGREDRKKEIGTVFPR